MLKLTIVPEGAGNNKAYEFTSWEELQDFVTTKLGVEPTSESTQLSPEDKKEDETEEKAKVEKELDEKRIKYHIDLGLEKLRSLLEDKK